MTGTRAASLLADILKWRLQPWTPIEKISAIRYDTEPVQGGSVPGLPFGLDSYHDTTWEDGPTGTAGPDGVDEWLQFWNPWMSYWANLPSVFREQPGAIFLQQLEENPVFNNVKNWDEDDQTAWTDFTNELRTMWHKIASATGNKPKNHGLCPQCKTGNLHSQPGKTGYEDQATCTKCHHTINYQQEDPAISIRAAMRQYDGEDIYLPLKDIRAIWPDINASTIRSWTRRGQVATNQHGYRLADINLRKRVPT